MERDDYVFDAECVGENEVAEWTIGDVFEDNGILSKHLTGYEKRDPQYKLALNVHSAMQDNNHIIGEAGTGTGKSFAYLVAAINSIQSSSGDSNRVVVATGNIALQEQLCQKDLPFLQKILPRFSFALVKGRNNYICQQAVEKLKAEYSAGVIQFGDDITEKPIEDFYKNMESGLVDILEWSKTTETGDRSDLDHEPEQEIWQKVSVQADECLGSDCPFYKTCFSVKARQVLQETEVIVVNYHILFAAVSLRMETGKDIILPPFRYLVCDEGHKVADIARNFFGWDISQYQISRLFSSFTKRRGQVELSQTQNSLADDIESGFTRISIDFFDSLSRLYGNSKGSLRLKYKIDSGQLGDRLVMIGKMFKDFEKLLSDKEAKAECRIKAKNANELGEGLLELAKMEKSNCVYYLEKFGRKGFIKICKRLLNVSDLIWDNVITKTDTTLITSATLAIDGDFKYIRNEIGLREAEEIIVGSPFDYPNQAMMVVSSNAPDPKADDYIDKVPPLCEAVINQVRGRTLCLFTSYRVMTAVADYLRGRIAYKLLVQGDSPRMQLIREFQEDVSSVLLGTDSFWTGVDIPGEALSCLIIDKIPFPSPGDPILDALVDKAGGFKNSFFKISIPRAVIQLRQGCGRLIRSCSDRGVLLILDNRLVTKGYGNIFTNSLPPMRRSNTTRNDTLINWIGA